MSGPLCGLVGSSLDGVRARNEYAAFITDTQRQRMQRGLFENYYGGVLTAHTVFDTNRA